MAILTDYNTWYVWYELPSLLLPKGIFRSKYLLWYDNFNTSGREDFNLLTHKVIIRISNAFLNHYLRFLTLLRLSKAPFFRRKYA
jgi:hypothetical protein